TIAGDAPVHSLMDGVNTNWSRVAGGDAIGDMVSKTIAQYNMDDPAKSLPALLDIYKALQNIKDEYWKKQKTTEVISLIQACAGLWTEADAEAAAVAPGDQLGIRIQAINRSNFPITLEKIIYPDGEKTVGEPLTNDKAFNADNTIRVHENTPFSQPYWLWGNHPTGYYIIKDQQLVGRPENPPAEEVKFVFNMNGTMVTVDRPVEYRYTDPVKGEVYQPLSIVPPVTANIENKVYIFSSGTPQKITVRLKSFIGKVQGTVSLELPAGFSARENNIPFALADKGDETDLSFLVAPKSAITHSSSEVLKAIIHYNGKEYTYGIKVISYSHIPVITVFPSATAKLVSVDLKTDGKKIGYIMGAGDMVPDALRQVGYEVTMLDDKDIAAGNLQQYDAIITGVRVYNVNKQMKFLQPRLLDYVKNGGVLVVQYNTNRGLVTDQLGPYPFRISGDRVTDETAKVNFLSPDNEVMNYPNKITEQDFDGWIQERGIYFPADADSHYTKLFSMHDPGESPLDGSTIVADYGKGKYVYSGLDFFRELPAGVPGAFRLFVNMIAKKQ
ncbi:MAG TPA: LmbE family protein, partial [Chitinophagaceae bacterium]